MPGYIRLLTRTDGDNACDKVAFAAALEEEAQADRRFSAWKRKKEMITDERNAALVMRSNLGRIPRQVAD